MSGGMGARDAAADQHNVHVDMEALKTPKKLIICCDGTWEDSDNQSTNPTNVTRISRAVSTYDDDSHQQIVYYQAGVGTGVGLYDHLVGGATGLGLAEHIREAYAFLVNNYSSDNRSSGAADVADSIFLIGFSRGAFTARSISGLLGAIGLLDKAAMQYFFDVFSDWENAGNKPPQFFKKYFQDFPDHDRGSAPTAGAKSKTMPDIDAYLQAYMAELVRLKLTQKVTVQAIGVWETVGSLGIPIPPFLLHIFHGLPAYLRNYQWFDTRIGDHVKNGYQALALDEHRAPYSPALWENKAGSTAKIKQVWFPGAHSNVGGSYMDYGIANLTIAWMMDHLSGHHDDGPFNSMDWIRFDDNSIETYHAERSRWYESIVHQLVEDHQVAPRRLPGWSLGIVYDSAVFPQSITGIRIRTPGRFHATDYTTGRFTTRLLENTNEYIHASVRARTRFNGSAPVIDWGKSFHFLKIVSAFFHKAWFLLPGHSRRPYNPSAAGQPLAKWELSPAPAEVAVEHLHPHRDTSSKRRHWIYNGNQRDLALPEDRLGGPNSYERQLLDLAYNRDCFEINDQGQVQHIELLENVKLTADLE